MKKVLAMLGFAIIVCLVFAALAPTIRAQPAHDISILSVTPNTSVQYPGRMVDIDVLVKNNGTTAENFNVTAYRNNTEIETEFGISLDPGENTTVTFHWNTSGLTPCNTWTIRAEAPLELDEYQDDNNVTGGSVKITILGDLDGNGTIELFDIVGAALAFGATPSDTEHWNPLADIVLDDLIDIFDLVVISQHYDEHC